MYNIMTKQDIAIKVIEIIAEMTPDKITVVAENTIQDLGLDSLDIIETSMSLEEEFNINIDDDELESLKTVQNAIDLIIKKLNK